MYVILNCFIYNVRFQSDVSACEMQNTNRILVGKPEGEGLFPRLELYARDLQCILKMQMVCCRLDTFCTGPVVGSFECGNESVPDFEES
jgi:hypothetical protein